MYITNRRGVVVAYVDDKEKLIHLIFSSRVIEAGAEQLEKYRFYYFKYVDKGTGYSELIPVSTVTANGKLVDGDYVYEF